MRRIQSVTAAAACAALVSAALAAGAASAAGSGARAKVLPGAGIEGKPARFKPSKLSAKARWTSSSCSSTSQASFSVANDENAAKTVKFKGSDGFTPFTYTVPAHATIYFCITKGYPGTLTGKLKDGQKLTVKF